MYDNSKEKFTSEIQSRHKQAEERISKLDDTTIDMVKSEELKEKKVKRDLEYHKEDQSVDCGSPKGQSEWKEQKAYLKK